MDYDVAIVGAGPAGAAAARLLATWGHRVVLLHRRAMTPSLAESIPPSCRKLLATCGILEAVDRAGCLRSSGNTVWWGSDEPRRESFAAGTHGYQVDRDVFDDLCREQARVAGAGILETIVREVVPGDEDAAARLDGGDEVRARFVLDCSGRAGVIARRWRTEVTAHPRTVALVGAWTSAAGWPGVDSTHTLVESYADGWVWSVPLSPHHRHVTAMVDPHRTRLARGRPANDVYRAELAKARHMAALLDRSTLERGPWGCDASVYNARTYAADPVLLVGDAASFVDPLSSFGIKKALASAWLAAVAVHTTLQAPAMGGVALDFFASREAAMFSSLLDQSRGQFEDAAATHQHSFWTDRAADFDADSVSEPDPRLLRDDPRVQDAFTWLKAQPAIALRATAGLRREAQPVVRGHTIVMEERLRPQVFPGGVRFLRDVDLIGVLTLAPSCDQVPALFETYNRRFPPVALPDFLGALSAMIAFGILEPFNPSPAH